MSQQAVHQVNLFHARRWSRRLALQALYQWQMTGQDLQEIERQFYEDENIHKADVPYFRELLHGVPALLDRLDAEIRVYLDRSIEAVDPVERALLRNACYELIHRRDVPYKVVINEAVELAKKFGAEQSHRFVNGVLDKVTMRLRSDETEEGLASK